MLWLQRVNTYFLAHWNFSLLDMASVIISAAAMTFAIFIPIRIAKRQDKVTLFEKRFAAYSDLLRLKSFADILDAPDYSFDLEAIKMSSPSPQLEIKKRLALVFLHFGIIFTPTFNDDNPQETVRSMLSVGKKLELSIAALPLLYYKELKKSRDTASKEVTEIFEALFLFFTDICLPNGSIDDKNREDFILKLNSFWEKYADAFEREFKI